LGDLSPEAQAALLQAAQQRGISLQSLSVILGLCQKGEYPQKRSETASDVPFQPRLDLALAEIRSLSQRQFWKIKRALDVLAALVALLILTPLFICVGLSVAGSIGFPIEFWQRRPGLGGRPFHLYKFRTMRAAYAPDGRHLTDEERVPLAGKFLRRTRL